MVEMGIIVKFPLVFLANFLLHLQLLIQGSFHQEQVKQPHGRETQRPYIMNYVVLPEASDHLPLATLPCLPDQCSHCGKNFSRESNMAKHMLVVHGLSCP